MKSVEAGKGYHCGPVDILESVKAGPEGERRLRGMDDRGEGETWRHRLGVLREIGILRGVDGFHIELFVISLLDDFPKLLVAGVLLADADETMELLVLFVFGLFEKVCLSAGRSKQASSAPTSLSSSAMNPCSFAFFGSTE